MPDIKYKTSYEMPIQGHFRQVKEFDVIWDSPQCGISLSTGIVTRFSFLEGDLEIEQVMWLLPTGLEDSENIILIRVLGEKTYTGVAHTSENVSVSDIVCSGYTGVFTRSSVEERYLN